MAELLAYKFLFVYLDSVVCIMHLIYNSSLA